MSPRLALTLGLLVAGGCLSAHLAREIPPPGGCDRCHRHRIAGSWEVVLAPARLGREGGIPEDVDVVLRGLTRVPGHDKVPAARLAVYAAGAPPEKVGDPETGIRCFVCHRSPGPPHDKAKATFHHPWGSGPKRP